WPLIVSSDSRAVSFPRHAWLPHRLGLSGSRGQPFTVIADPNANTVRAQLHDLWAISALDDFADGAIRQAGELGPLRKRQHAVEVFTDRCEHLVPLAEGEHWCFGIEFDNLLHAGFSFFR